MVFSALTEEIHKQWVMILPPLIHQRESSAGFQIHVSSLIHEALMPYHPCATLHMIKKHMNQAQLESISVEGKNVLGHNIEDRFAGITAKTGYQKPNPLG